MLEFLSMANNKLWGSLLGFISGVFLIVKTQFLFFTIGLLFVLLLFLFDRLFIEGPVFGDGEE